MKILYISPEFLAPDLALRMRNEGHEVLLAIEEPCDILKGTLKRVDYAKRLEIAPSCDLVVYDDKSEGEASMLRSQGISVIGGSEKTDRIELDRVHANKLAEACGMKVPKLHPVKSIKEAKKFLEENKGRWVFKQMGKLDSVKGLNFVAKMDDSEDLITYLEWLDKKWIDGIKQEFCLQEFVEGHEFACGSYWNGHEFQKDADGDELCEENWEHKPLMSGNMGESTGEMFTIMHYVKAKNSKLFNETLDKFRLMLKKIDFRGDFDINCKVCEKGVYFLEFTPRMGVPATSAQIAIQNTDWSHFLKAMADGIQVEDYKYNQGYCVVSWLYCKPFPALNSTKVSQMASDYFEKKKNKDEGDIAEALGYKLNDSYGFPVLFNEKLTPDELNNLHFDGVMMEDGKLKVANDLGYVLTVTGMGQTVDEASEKVENLLKKIIVPKSFWRNDFKKSGYHKSRNDLIDWGYLDEEKDEDELETIKKQLKEVLKK